MLGGRVGPAGPARVGVATHGAVSAHGILALTVRFLTGSPA
jgi:hypothetical protein